MMSSRSADKIKFTSFDELFGDPVQEVQAEKTAEPGQEKIIRVPLAELHPFKNHPFRVMDDEKMEETVESIKQYGVLVPAIVRPDKNGGYELIAGHRRKRGSELAGCADMPVIIRELTDDEATIIMVDSNIQREDILPSEKAWAYRMKMEALGHQGSKGAKHTAVLVGEAAGESARTVQRFIRLTYLLPELLHFIDQEQLASFTGEKLSYLTEKEQKWVLQEIKENQVIPIGSQAEKLKEESIKKTLTYHRVQEILKQNEKPSGISIPAKKIRSYFPQGYTKKQMETVIFELLDSWKEKQETENAGGQTKGLE